MRHLLQACAKNAQQCLATMIYSIYEAFNPTSTPTFMIAKFKTIYQRYHSLNLLTMSLLDFQLFNTIKIIILAYVHCFKTKFTDVFEEICLWNKRKNKIRCRFSNILNRDFKFNICHFENTINLITRSKHWIKIKTWYNLTMDSWEADL